MRKVDFLFERLLPGDEWSIAFPYIIAAVGSVFSFLVACCVILFVVTALRSFKRLRSQSRGVAQLLLVGLALIQHVMMLFMDATNQPHYFQAVWWLPFVMMGFVLDDFVKYRFRNQHIQKLLMVCAVAYAFGSFILSGLMQQAYARDGGIALLHFGPTYTEQKNAIARLCAQQRASGSIGIVNNSQVIGESCVRWHLQVNPDCAVILHRYSPQNTGVMPVFVGQTARIDWIELD